MDAEPRYEDHPAACNPDYGYYWDAADVRQNAYSSLLEGACGHTYGNHGVWCFNTEPTPYCPFVWQEVLCHDGAQQMCYFKELRLSRPFFELRPAPELLLKDAYNTLAFGKQTAARGERYGLVYTPQGLPLRVGLTYLGGPALKTSWFDPCTGRTTTFASGPCLFRRLPESDRIGC